MVGGASERELLVVGRKAFFLLLKKERNICRRKGSREGIPRRC